MTPFPIIIIIATKWGLQVANSKWVEVVWEWLIGQKFIGGLEDELMKSLIIQRYNNWETKVNSKKK